MRVELNPSYILHHRPYRETSLLLDVFSRQHGRLSLVAKGGRKQKNDKRALLQPGRQVNLAWTARRELGVLTQVEPGLAGPPATGRALLPLFYVNELLVRLLHRHEPHPEIFDAYEAALAGLASAAAEQAILRVFEKRLLQALGYGLVLNADTEGGGIKADGDYTYLVERGPVPGTAPGGLSISGRALLALAEENLADQRILGEAKQLMRLALGNLLGERQLGSRALYEFQPRRAAAP